MRSLKAKLFFLVGIGAASIIGLAAISFKEASELYNVTKIFFEQRLPITGLEADITEASSNVFRYTWLALATTTSKSERESRWTTADQMIKSMEDNIAKMELFNIHPASRERLNELKSIAKELRSVRGEAWSLLSQMTVEQDNQGRDLLQSRVPELGKKITEATNFLDEKATARNEQYAEEARATRENLILVLSIGSFLSIAIFAGIGIVLAIKVSRGLSGVATRVGENAKALTHASEEMAQTASQLSQASQEQAAALEESSASIEEISSMVERNRDQAGQAKSLTDESQRLVSQMSESMQSLVIAMHEIQTANEQVGQFRNLMNDISEKTKIIDEIVFQTRLLSFNASVEAERAGEHGRGFAVVAQEVGALAQVSGKSALEISEILKAAIEKVTEISSQTSQKVKSGVQLCQSTEAIAKKVAEQTTSLRIGAEEIFQGSNEQTTGLRQISSGVESMNQTTQSNAATAEEASAASSVLSQQAMQLSNEVEILAQIVFGKRLDQRAFEFNEQVSPIDQRKNSQLRDNSLPLRRAS